MNDVRALWDSGKAYDAGLRVLENLPHDEQPGWAAQILRLVVRRSGVDHAVIAEVLAVADEPEEWSAAHTVFSRVRAELRRLDSKRAAGLSDGELLLSYVFSMAELVAKVTYNATKPIDEFDEDSGAWIVDSLRGFVDMWGYDEGFAHKAYELVRRGA